MGVKVHLVDGTFELFRCFHGAPRATGPDGHEVGAIRGLVATLIALLAEPDVSHVAIAFDSVVSPPGARTSNTAEGLISSQLTLAANAVRALGLPVWPSGRYQADELVATAAHRFASDPAVDQVVICSNDNDFTQCVEGYRVVILNRIHKRITDEDGVRERFGVAPAQIPDLFALIGDRSDGLPGVPGWGPRSATAVLARYGHLVDIPVDPDQWDLNIRGRVQLAAALAARRDEALLCRDLSVLRTDLPLRATLADLEWQGADRVELERVCHLIGETTYLDWLQKWKERAP